MTQNIIMVNIIYLSKKPLPCVLVLRNILSQKLIISLSVNFALQLLDNHNFSKIVT